MSELRRVPTVYPTLEELRDLVAYVDSQFETLQDSGAIIIQPPLAFKSALCKANGLPEGRVEQKVDLDPSLDLLQTPVIQEILSSSLFSLCHQTVQELGWESVSLSPRVRSYAIIDNVFEVRPGLSRAPTNVSANDPPT